MSFRHHSTSFVLVRQHQYKVFWVNCHSMSFWHHSTYFVLMRQYQSKLFWVNCHSMSFWHHSASFVLMRQHQFKLFWVNCREKKSEQILIAPIPVHPVILESSWDDSRMTEWLGLGFKPMEILHPCPSRHPQSSKEWLRQERMTKNDEKFRRKAFALDFFPHHMF